MDCVCVNYSFSKVHKHLSFVIEVTVCVRKEPGSNQFYI